MYFTYVLVLAVPITVIALAVRLDRRSGRGYALGLLSVIVLALDIWGIVAFTQAAQQASASHTDDLGFAIVLAVYILIGLVLGLAIVIGGIVETVTARQRGWLVIIIVGSFLPAGIILAPGTALVPDFLGALGLSRGAEVVVLLLLPVLITLCYAIARTLRPVPPSGSQGTRGAVARLPW